MQYEITGSGTPLVLVPGGLSGWLSWEPHAKILSENYKVVRVQLLNVQCGLENRELPPAYSVQTESDALCETLNGLQLSAPADIVGWSYGAFVAMQYALDYPERIRTLTLIEPPALWLLRTSGKFDEASQREADFFLTVNGDITEDMLDHFLQHAGFTEEGKSARELPQWEKWIPFRQSLRNCPAAVNFEDDKQRLRNFAKPTLLVKGTGSAAWLHNIIDELSRNLPNSRIVEFPGAHAPHLASREFFLNELSKFLRDGGM